MSVITNNTIQPSSGQALTIKDEGGTASITVATNGEATFAENIKITANKGINFSAYGSEDSESATTVSSNLLDDYEEGTWTLTVTPTGGTITTQSNHYGFYQKIGNYVTLEFGFKIDDAGSANGNYRVQGLPFVISNYGSGKAPAGCGYESVATGNMLEVLSVGTNEVQVRKYDHTGITTNGSFFNASITYQSN